jgi:hypothetical protein
MLGWMALGRASAVAFGLLGLAACRYGIYDGSYDGDGGVISGGDGTVTVVEPGRDTQVVSVDQNFSLHIPTGALTVTTRITIKRRDQLGGTNVSSPVYDVAMESGGFASPVTAQLRLTSGAPVGRPEDQVQLGRQMGSGTQPLPIGGKNGNVYYGLTRDVGAFMLVGVNAQQTSIMSGCVASCCGGGGGMRVTTAPNPSCQCLSGALPSVYQCLEHCNLESDVAACTASAAQVQCGPSTCDAPMKCCLDGGQHCLGNTADCRGTVLECDGIADCPQGQVCCLSGKLAHCSTTCDPAHQLCRPGSSSNPGAAPQECGSCGSPGAGCPFNTCGRAPLPDVCP